MTGESSDVVLSLTDRAVVSRAVLDPRTDGQAIAEMPALR